MQKGTRKYANGLAQRGSMMERSYKGLGQQKKTRGGIEEKRGD